MADARSELSELKRIGAVPQPNSGRGKHAKGDGVLDDQWLIDVKEYTKSFSVSRSAWGKLCDDAFKAGQLEPMFLLALRDEPEGAPIRLVVHSWNDFEHMRDRIFDLETKVEQMENDMITHMSKNTCLPILRSDVL